MPFASCRFQCQKSVSVVGSALIESHSACNAETMQLQCTACDQFRDEISSLLPSSVQNYFALETPVGEVSSVS